MSISDLNSTIIAQPLSKDDLVAGAAQPAQSATDDPYGEAPPHESFSVTLRSSGDSKINVIKIVREITGLDLHAAKDLVDNCGVVAYNLSHEEAEEIAARLQEAGATCEVR